MKTTWHAKDATNGQIAQVSLLVAVGCGGMFCGLGVITHQPLGFNLFQAGLFALLFGAVTAIAQVRERQKAREKKGVQQFVDDLMELPASERAEFYKLLAQSLREIADGN